MPQPNLILHTDRDQTVDDADRASIEEGGGRLLYVTGDAEFSQNASQALAVLNSNFRLTPALIDRLDHCRVISRYGSGFDNINVDAASRKGIPVCNVPVFCVEEVANRAFTLLLACSCDFLNLDRFTRAGHWGAQNLPFAFQVEGQTLGLIGYGKIGRAVARRAVAFGLTIVAYDPYLPDHAISAGGASHRPLDELLRISDYVSVHTPLTSETAHLLDDRRLRLMKRTAVLINTARGGIIEEAALIEALREGRIAAAGLDVFETEPPASNNPLFAMKNVVLTPHCAAHTVLTTAKVRRGAVDNVLRALKGEPLQNIVNAEALAAGSARR